MCICISRSRIEMEEPGADWTWKTSTALFEDGEDEMVRRMQEVMCEEIMSGKTTP